MNYEWDAGELPRLFNFIPPFLVRSEELGVVGNAECRTQNDSLLDQEKKNSPAAETANAGRQILLKK